jgi:hypothetical protein
VVQDHHRRRHRTREFEELEVLVVVVPRVVREPSLAQGGDARAEDGVARESVWRAAGDRKDIRLSGVRDRITNAAEEPTGCLRMRVEDVLEVGCPKIRVRDDATDQMCRIPLCFGGGECRLADRGERWWARTAVRDTTLDEDGLDYAVSRGDVLAQILQPVVELIIGRGPEVVVRVDDLEVGLKDNLVDQGVPLVSPSLRLRHRSAVSSLWPPRASRRGSRHQRWRSGRP